MNYSEISVAAKAYADRQDIEVSDNMDVFILMAEARMNRVLKTREQTARSYTLTLLDEEYYPLPPDYRGMRSLHLNSTAPTDPHSTSNYNYINSDSFNVLRGRACVDANYYTIIANQIRILPVQAAGLTIEMVYYQKVPCLSAANPNNWMSDEHPDIYLAGILAEIESFVKNYEIATAWDSKMTRAMGELENSDVQERWAGNPLIIKLG